MVLRKLGGMGGGRKFDGSPSKTDVNAGGNWMGEVVTGGTHLSHI